MSEAEPGADTTQIPRRPGERLRDARIAQGLDLGDIAARTRIPQRHLESIEAGTYADLPSPTYAMGFARAYARAVGVDEVALASDVRGELGDGRERPVHRTIPAYEIADPSRQPSRGLVLGGAIVAIVVLIGIGLYYGTSLFRGGATPAATEAVAVPIPQTVSAPPSPTPGAGQVALTATDEVWVHVSDAGGQTLMMKTMTPGERFEVPASATDPRIEVGRPDKLAITVGGTAIQPLGDGRVAIRDVSLRPQALLARGTATPTAAATPSPTASAKPAPRPSPTPTATRPTPRPTPTATPTRAAPPPAAVPAPRVTEPAPGNAAAPL